MEASVPHHGTHSSKAWKPDFQSVELTIPKRGRIYTVIWKPSQSAHIPVIIALSLYYNAIIASYNAVVAKYNGIYFVFHKEKSKSKRLFQEIVMPLMEKSVNLPLLSLNKPVSVTAMNIYEFDDEGKIIREHGLPDLFTMLGQLGLLPKK